jgi:hypothetical protein
MYPVLVPIAREPVRSHAVPLHRSLPAAPRVERGQRLRTALLAVAGVVVFVDIEFALAYVLYFATRLVN